MFHVREELCRHAQVFMKYIKLIDVTKLFGPI